jgi:hypothetical protein
MHTKKLNRKQHRMSGGVAELANASIIHPRVPGSNLSTDRKYFHILFASLLNPNL